MKQASLVLRVKVVSGLSLAANSDVLRRSGRRTARLPSLRVSCGCVSVPAAAAAVVRIVGSAKHKADYTATPRKVAARLLVHRKNAASEPPWIQDRLSWTVADVS